jgi:hypothetical protein
MEKGKEIVKNLESAIAKIQNKEHKVIFMVPDTKGNGKSSVIHLYNQALTLKKAGYNVAMLHEKNDFIKVGAWLSTECDEIEHMSIEDNNLVVGPSDFMIVPEVYGSVFEQIATMPLEKVIYVQSFDYMLEAFSPGKSWLDSGAEECITTSNTLKNMIEDTVSIKDVQFIEPKVGPNFSPSEKPQKPIVAIHCREARKAAKIIKSFYMKYPIYRFISFKDMHTMNHEDFAKNLKECCVSVWIDDDSSFGRFPVESIKCNVPVIGKVPNIIPEWMTDENGVWVYDENQMPEILSSFLKNWLDDTLPENLTSVSETITEKYSEELFEKNTLEVYQHLFDKKVSKLEKIKENFKETLQEDEQK